MTPTPVTLDAQAIDAIARRVADLLVHRDAAKGTAFVDAAELARRLGVEREWVYAHASELGAIRLGSGSTPRLRFDPAIAIERMNASAKEARPEPSRSLARRQSRAPRSGGAPLLPIKRSRTSRPRVS